MKKTSLLGYATCSLLLGSIAQAAPLVYEGFNYGATNGAIDGTTTNALGLTGDYTTADGFDSGTNTQTSEYIATGLTFGSMSTTGGALKQTVLSNADSKKEYVYSYASLNTSPTAGTTIYNSFLANISTNTMIASSAVTSVRIQDSSSLTGNASGQMVVRPLSGSSDTKSAVGYDGGGFVASSGPTLNTTYLYISKFTNVGGAGGGDASLWALDSDSYNDWQTLGGGTEATLGTYADFTDTDSDTGTISFSSLQSLRLLTAEFTPDYNTGSAAYTVNGELTTTYDEIRYGTSLNDVTAIPEPATFALLFGGLALGTTLLRRRR